MVRPSRRTMYLTATAPEPTPVGCSMVRETGPGDPPKAETSRPGPPDAPRPPLQPSDRKGVHLLDQALRLLPRQAPPPGTGRTGGHRVSHRARSPRPGCGLDAEPGPVCPALPLPGGARRRAASARRSGAGQASPTPACRAHDGRGSCRPEPHAGNPPLDGGAAVRRGTSAARVLSATGPGRGLCEEPDPRPRRQRRQGPRHDVARSGEGRPGAPPHPGAGAAPSGPPAGRRVG
jgi:hypothetical protein